MRKSIALTGATVALLSLAIPGAIAETTPTPAPTSTPLSPFEQYRLDREIYFAAMKEITNNFKAACDSANSNYAAQLLQAKSKDQKRAARLARESAITAATIDFESAKIALGPMPVEPQRMVKAPLKSKEKRR